MKKAGSLDKAAVLTDAQRRELLATMKDEYHDPRVMEARA